MAVGNLLGDATSPYLRQHAANPVHWREWNESALAEAAERDVPILLSVGYAACHWCHVMAHESFEDDATAQVMNEFFVCIKVDREERPDIDAVYMNATVAMTGQGGWPMTCFLTPSGEPFYCGTYFPPEPRHGMPAFGQLLAAIVEAWTQRRDEVLGVGAKVAEHVRSAAAPLPAGALGLDRGLIERAATAVLAEEDTVSGGFGGAPKFPPSALLEGLLRVAEYGSAGGDGGEAFVAEVSAAVARSCAAMARGGIYDQLAGGFARYAVDSGWVVPHFEKMLYDNAQLLRVYAHLARRTDNPLAQRITREIVEFLDRDLGVEGGYASALDADTEGVEGATYVWTPAQLREVLGDDDGAWSADLFTVTQDGTFEHGTSTLQLLADPDDEERYRDVRTRLLAARDTRPQPDRDDKVVTGWNAMAVTALVEAGVALAQPEWIVTGARIANGLLRDHRVDGLLRRSSLGGRVGVPLAALDDHAALCTALFTLHQATGELRWRDEAVALLDETIERFGDPAEVGSWFDAPAAQGQTQDDLLARPRDPVDGATPSGASLLLEALLLASTLTPVDRSTRYARLFDATAARATILLDKAPRSAGHWLSVLASAVAGPVQIAVAETEDSDHTLAEYARAIAPGGTVVVAGQRDSVDLLVERGPVDGHDAAYVCRGSACSLPITDPAELAANL